MWVVQGRQLRHGRGQGHFEVTWHVQAQQDRLCHEGTATPKAAQANKKSEIRPSILALSTKDQAPVKQASERQSSEWQREGEASRQQTLAQANEAPRMMKMTLHQVAHRTLTSRMTRTL